MVDSEIQKTDNECKCFSMALPRRARVDRSFRSLGRYRWFYSQKKHPQSCLFSKAAKKLNEKACTFANGHPDDDYDRESENLHILCWKFAVLNAFMVPMALWTERATIGFPCLSLHISVSVTAVCRLLPSKCARTAFFFFCFFCTTTEVANTRS